MLQEVIEMDREQLKVMKEAALMRLEQEKKNLETVEENKIKRKDDRLKIIQNFTHVHKVLLDVVGSWGNILLDKTFLEILDRGELKEVHDAFSAFTKDFIHFDEVVVDCFHERIMELIGPEEQKKERAPGYIV
jgi:hypothetical protein